MRSYGQFCPVAKTAEVFCQRWNALIIRDLSWGSSTFTELKRGVPMMSPALLTTRLKEALSLVEVRVLDHIVVGDGRYMSFADQGWLSEGEWIRA